MIDYEKLSYWIGCQYADIKEAYDEQPSYYLYGLLNAFDAFRAQLNIVWTASEVETEEEMQPPFEGPVEGFQSNASKVLNNIHDSLRGVDLSKVKSAKFHDCTKSKDCDSEYEPGYCAHPGVKLECQHESDGNCYSPNPPVAKCKKCGEFYR